eukprot:TRINITY_DN44539_c0_g1_i1.p1 TRINITY_DN44539_c0_g1~~TRINITY_DN44539_c0_g1_i1.p1  ORF type:complete len:691 (-),score=133.80 TRINITY_DN44539_c0_g1_i1:75-2147(-)
MEHPPFIEQAATPVFTDEHELYEQFSCFNVSPARELHGADHEWEWEFELNQWDLSTEKVWGMFHQLAPLTPTSGEERGITFARFQELLKRAEITPGLSTKLFNYFNYKQDGDVIEKEVIQFGEFEAAMRRLVQYEWQAFGWRACHQLQGCATLFEQLHQRRSIGIVDYTTDAMGMKLGLCAVAIEMRRTHQSARTRTNLWKALDESAHSHRFSESGCDQGPSGYDHFFHGEDQTTLEAGREWFDLDTERTARRWVRSRGNSTELIVTVGLRYGIHPLIMEDALHMRGQKTVSRVEWWTRGRTVPEACSHETLQIMIPICRLSQADVQNIAVARKRLADIVEGAGEDAQKHAKMELWKSEMKAHIGSPQAEIPNADTDDESSTEECWSTACPMSTHVDLAWVCLLVPVKNHESNLLISFEGPWCKFSSSLVEDDTEAAKDEYTWGSSEDYFSKALHLLSIQGSRLRDASSVHPLCAQLIGIAVDGYSKVVDALEIKVEVATMMLRYYEHSLDKQILDMIRRLTRKAKKLGRTIRPVQLCLEQLLEHPVTNEFSPIYRDILNEIITVREDIADVLAAAQVVLDEHKACLGDVANLQDQRMNDVLYFLTLVTTAIVPVQLMTGLYGMNFVTCTDDGTCTPNMPELTWGYGYLFFWVVAIGLTFMLLGLMKLSVGFDFRRVSTPAQRGRFKDLI